MQPLGCALIGKYQNWDGVIWSDAKQSNSHHPKDDYFPSGCPEVFYSFSTSDCY